MKDTAPRSPLPFVKMHGLGNDFVILWSRGRTPCVTPALARMLADRRFGVGCDQVVDVCETDHADLRLTFFNPDGSRSGACGNATRCIAAYEFARCDADMLTIATDFGLLRAERGADGTVRVNMGKPVLEWQGVPLSQPVDTSALPLRGSPSAVGMGNPHCIHFVEDVTAIDLATIGAEIEHHPLFPERTNVEFAERRADGTLRLRVWERGAGITLACGSGACATAVAAHRLGLTGPEVDLELDGGWLRVACREDGVWMEGPTAHVFDGTLSAAFMENVQ